MRLIHSLRFEKHNNEQDSTMDRPAMTKTEPVLYAYNLCPYCRRVMGFMRDHAIDIPIKDPLVDPSVRAELVALGGKSQFPALLVNGAVIYESPTIIDWLKQNMVAELDQP